MHYLKPFFTFYLFFLLISFSHAQKNNAAISIDNFDEASKALAQTNWFTYNDHSDGGKSICANSIVKKSTNKNKYMQFTYTLDQGKCMWAPYTALSCNIISNVSTGMQAISYRFKGNAHKFIVKTTNIKDYCYYNISIPASPIWTILTIPISELRQPSWGGKASLDITTFEGLSWQVSGNTNDTGMVFIDDVKLLFTPQPASNLKPIVQKPVLNSDIIGLDNFDGTNNALVQTSWFTFNDNNDGGNSTSANSITKESTNNNQYMQFTYTLNQGKYKWAPYTALSFNITSYALPDGIQAVSYRFKGNAHTLIVKTTNIKDYCYYNIDIPASPIWTTVTIPVSELRQPWWGQQAPLEIKAFEGLSWLVSGKTDDNGTVSIDDVNLLYSPQLAINPKSVAKKLLADTIHTIHSNILNEDREIYMYLPPSYDASKPNLKKYPVVYLLDGNVHIEYVGGLIEKLSAVNYNTAFPEMIVVGIKNTNRTRDLSPTHITVDPFELASKRFDSSGGGAAFMSFIEKELMPMIEKTYPTANYKTLVGHSLGGLTVIHTLINKSYLFDAYIALDPSLWWDNELLLKQVNSTYEKINLSNKKLYIAIANDIYKGVDTEQVKKDTSSFFLPLKANLNFIDVLNKYTTTGLTWNYTYYPDENHHTVTNSGQLDGLKYLFELKQADIDKHFKVTTTDSRFVILNTLACSDMGYTVYAPEKLINDYAYSYLAKKNYTLAFDLFQLNVNNYPLSPFVFDALGDYYVATGDVEHARKNYANAILLGQGRLAETKRKLDKLGSEK